MLLPNPGVLTVPDLHNTPSSDTAPEKQMAALDGSTKTTASADGLLEYSPRRVGIHTGSSRNSLAGVSFSSSATVTRSPHIGCWEPL